MGAYIQPNVLASATQQHRTRLCIRGFHATTNHVNSFLSRGFLTAQLFIYLKAMPVNCWQRQVHQACNPVTATWPVAVRCAWLSSLQYKWYLKCFVLALMAVIDGQISGIKSPPHVGTRRPMG